MLSALPKCVVRIQIRNSAEESDLTHWRVAYAVSD